MKMSKMFMPTLREVPADAEITSHQLMLRAGMIRKMASGVYNQLPMGIRVFNKIQEIIREELNKKGFNIDKKIIELDHQIDTLGIHKVSIKLHKKVVASLTISVKEV